MIHTIIKGFSLIELMVVIAIISILAAVSVPAYSNYILRVKLNQVNSYAHNVADVMKRYYSQHGAYATTVQAYGYTNATMPPTSVNQMAPYVALLSNDAGGSPIGSCPGTNFVVGFAGIDGSKELPNFIGGSDSDSYGHGGIGFYYISEDANGLIHVFCTYMLFQNGVQITGGDIGLPGCTNNADAAAMTEFEASVAYINDC